MRQRRHGLIGSILVALLFVLRSAPAAAAPDPEPPEFRLPGGARPTGYRVELAIDPSKTTFRGAVDIDIRVEKRTDFLWLNATDLKVEKVSATLSGRYLGVRVVPGGSDYLGFAFAQPVDPGGVSLHVEYTAPIDETSTQGVFRQKDGEDWYVFSQLASTDARRAFPCFDEPSYKVPWQLTLLIPQGASAVSNTPIAKQSELKDGRSRVRFRKTEPLPSYLVAFAVGPFDYVDAGTAGTKKTPIRIVVPRGKSARARYAVETSGAILERLEAYFGTAFPYAKLDQLAIPQTVAFGAMENAGLVTWAESLLLAPPEEETIKFRRTQADVNAHEMAHQWFGDLVTLAWWDDVWLNESFATWMADRTLQEWKPEWGVDVERVVARSNVMADDTLVSARKIHQEVLAPDDIVDAFDAISYQKGAAVLTMFESWVGPRKFQAGVRAYLAAHRYSTATSKDFLDALEAASHPGVAAAFASFLDQPGVPLVEVALDCGPDGATLALSQKRFLPVGTRGSTAETWRVPVCARDPGGRACTLLAEPAGSAAASAGACPAWVLANDGELGYYRALYRGDLLGKLLAVADRDLSVAERVGLLRDLDALAMGGALPIGEALALVPRFAGDPAREVVAATVRIATDTSGSLVPEDLEPAYARFLSKTYGARARVLGFASQPGEDEATRLLRADLVPFVAKNGDEPALQAEARRLALAWLDDRSAVEADLVGAVFETAARHGDRALFERYTAGLKTAKERRDRVRIFRALGAFPDAALLEEAFALAGQADPREAGYIYFTALQTPAGQKIEWQYVKTHYDQILARMPREAASFIPLYAGGSCEPAHRTDAAEFFSTRVDKLPGGPRNLAQVLETMDLCIALRGVQEAGAREFLGRY